MLIFAVVFLIILVALIVFIGGQLVYRGITDKRRQCWEKNVERDENGIRIDCKAYTLEANSDAAILLIHGFADSPAVFQNLAQHFHAQNITVRAMRLPGFGVTINHQAAITTQNWIQAVEQEVKQLSANHKQVWIAAHSLGCAISLHWQTETEQNIHGLFLLAPLIRVSNQRSILFSARTWFRLGQRLFKHIHTLENLLPCDIRYPLPSNQLPTDRFVHFAIYDALFSMVEHFKRNELLLKIPTTVFFARYDRIVDNAAAREVFANAKPQPPEMIEMEQSGHVLPLDNEWQAIAETITRRITA